MTEETAPTVTISLTVAYALLDIAGNNARTFADISAISNLNDAIDKAEMVPEKVSPFAALAKLKDKS